jgi:hypothetical protein
MGVSASVIKESETKETRKMKNEIDNTGKKFITLKCNKKL